MNCPLPHTGSAGKRNNIITLDVFLQAFGEMPETMKQKNGGNREYG